MAREASLWVYLSQEKKEDIETHLNEYLEMKGMSKYGNKSDLLADIVLQGLKDRMASHIPDTHTIPQGSQKSQREQYLNHLISSLKSQQFSYLDHYIGLILKEGPTSDLKTRTKATWVHGFLAHDEVHILPLFLYADTSGMVVISRSSPWYPQLKELTFKFNPDWLKITNAHESDKGYIEKLKNILRKKSTYKPMDKAEHTMILALLYEMGIQKDKPMYSHEDFTLREVIRLRSEHNFREADDMLELEKQQQKQAQTVSSVSQSSARSEADAFFDGMGGDL